MPKPKPKLDKIAREKFRPMEHGGWYAPRSAKLPIEDEMETLLASMSYSASEVDRTKRIGEEHEQMVEHLRESREKLLELCARYPAEHARLKGCHRADGWKRPEREPR